MEQVIITKVYKSDKKKDGQEFKTKDGKKFWRVAIQTDRHGEEWLSTLAFKEDDKAMKLKEGDEVMLKVEDTDYGLNFRLPSRLDVEIANLQTQINALKARLDRIEGDTPKDTESPLEAKNEPDTAPVVDYPEDSINPDDIPFSQS